VPEKEKKKKRKDYRGGDKCRKKMAVAKKERLDLYGRLV